MTATELTFLCVATLAVTGWIVGLFGGGFVIVALIHIACFAAFLEIVWRAPVMDWPEWD